MTADTRWFADGRLHFALGIENTFVPQSGPGERPIDEYALTGHDVLLESDLALTAHAGAELVRWGVPWHRVQPEPGRWDWDLVDRAADAFEEHGIRPIIDLLHYGTPLWLEREFAAPAFPERFAEFAATLAARYDGRFHDYTPVNEPMIHALFCGEYAYWPPKLDGSRGLVTMVRQLGRGFVLAQRAIAEVATDPVFVHVDAGMRFDGAVERAHEIIHLRHQVWLAEDLVTGSVGEAHPLRGFLERNGTTDDELAWFRDHAVAPDVTGVNYYPRHSTELLLAGEHHRGGFADPRPTRDDGVAGLTELLVEGARRYGAPVMLTETAVTASVADRVAWLDESVRAIRELRATGVDVVGYTWWPVFDMYEWTYRHSTAPRADHLLSMGLWELVEQGPDGQIADDHLPPLRRPTALVDRFREHARSTDPEEY